MTEMPANNEGTPTYHEREHPVSSIVAPSITGETQSALLCALLTHASEGVAFIDRDFIIRGANETIARQLQVRIDRLIDRPAAEVLAGWPNPGRPVYEQVREGGTPFHATTYPFEPQGQPVGEMVYWDVTISPVYDAGGDFLGYLLLQSDVTDSKQREDALREANEGLATAAIGAQESVEREHRSRKRVQKRVDDLSVVNEELREAQQRLAFLADLGAALASSLDYEATLQRVAQLVVPDFADGCVVEIIEDGESRNAMVAHADPAKEKILRELRRRYPPRPVDAHPLWRATKTLKPVLINEVPDSALQAYARDAEHLDMLRALVGKSHLALPLISRGRAFGTITLSASSHVYDEEDVAMAEQISRRAAAAIDAARLYQQAQLEKARWQATVDSMLDPVTVSDAEGRVTYINPEYVNHIGRQVKPGLDVGKYAGHYRLFRPDGTMFEDQDLPLQRAALRGEEVRKVQVVHRAADGEEYIGLFNASPIRLTDGQTAGAVAVGRDITEEVRAARRLEETLEQVKELNARLAEDKWMLQSIIDQLPGGVVVCDVTGTIVQTNEAARRLYQHPNPQGLPLPLHAEALHLYQPDGQPYIPERLPLARSALEGIVLENVEVIIRRPDGSERVMLCNTAPLHDEKGAVTGAIGVFRDTTELKEVEKLRQEYIALISHDLRSPLTAIIGQADLLRHRISKEGDARLLPSVDAIISGGKRMNAMIQDLIDSAKLESRTMPLDRQPIWLPSFVRDCVSRMVAPAEKGRIDLDLDEGLPTVLADPGRLERVLTNLITNALKYCPGTSRIDVRAVRGDDGLVIAVADRGPGVAEEDLPRLFERFYRAYDQRKGEGLGLGLYISRLIVEAHGGRIWAESEVGNGSTFYFTLPLA